MRMRMWMRDEDAYGDDIVGGVMVVVIVDGDDVMAQVVGQAGNDHVIRPGGGG